MGKDAIEKLVDLLREAAPDYPPDKLYASAWILRRDIGGAPNYIKKASATGKALCLGSALAAGVPMSQAFDEVGVSRSTGFRLIRRHGRTGA